MSLLADFRLLVSRDFFRVRNLREGDMEGKLRREGAWEPDFLEALWEGRDEGRLNADRPGTDGALLHARKTKPTDN